MTLPSPAWRGPYRTPVPFDRETVLLDIKQQKEQSGVPPCEHGLHVCRDCDRYWWHARIARELVRLRDECDSNGYNLTGLAGNVQMGKWDVCKYVTQMVAWGEVESCDPLWDYADLWVRLASEEAA